MQGRAMAIQRFASFGTGRMERIADLAVISARRARDYALELAARVFRPDSRAPRRRFGKLALPQLARLAVDGLIVCTSVLLSQAVAIAYLIVGTISVMLPEMITLPRSVLVASWVLSWLGLLHARVWASAWRLVVAPKNASMDAGHAGTPKPRTVLVIGGGGYIGSALVPRLLAGGGCVGILGV